MNLAPVQAALKQPLDLKSPLTAHPLGLIAGTVAFAVTGGARRNLSLFPCGRRPSFPSGRQKATPWLRMWATPKRQTTSA